MKLTELQTTALYLALAADGLVNVGRGSWEVLPMIGHCETSLTSNTINALCRRSLLVRPGARGRRRGAGNVAQLTPAGELAAAKVLCARKACPGCDRRSLEVVTENPARLACAACGAMWDRPVCLAQEIEGWGRWREVPA